MKKMIISILLLACCCIASKPTHYFEGKWYNCNEYVIVEPKYYNQTVCSEDGTCIDYDSKGNKIHYKNSNGYESWSDYDSKGNRIHVKRSDGAELWYDYDSKGNMIQRKDSNGDEMWHDYDSKGNEIHWKDSNGYEWWYKWFFNKKENKKYQCYVDRDGNPEF